MNARILPHRLLSPALVALTLAALGWVSVGRAAPLGSTVLLGQAAKPPLPMSAAELADRVQHFYDQSKTFKAKFKQRSAIMHWPLPI